MHVDVLFETSIADDSRYPGDHNSYDAGRFQYSIIKSKRLGRDNGLLQAGHHKEPPDVIVCHSSVFSFDLARMLKFVLSSRRKAPWMIFVLLLNTAEKDEMEALPTQLQEHFSGYFYEIKDIFSLDDVVQAVSSRFDLIERHMMDKRKRKFGTTIVSRRSLNDVIAENERQEKSYEFALSFAGAQRHEARDLASVLKGRGCTVFFDEYETSSLIGTNLAECLQDIYAKQSAYCILMASKAYVEGPWTTQERRAALDAAVKQFKRPYIQMWNCQAFPHL
jgi:hypothetical protein